MAIRGSKIDNFDELGFLVGSRGFDTFNFLDLVFYEYTILGDPPTDQ